MDLKDKLIEIQKLGVSLAKIVEPIHRTTISKWIHNEGVLSLEKQEYITQKLKEFKEKINEVL